MHYVNALSCSNCRFIAFTAPKLQIVEVSKLDVFGKFLLGIDNINPEIMIQIPPDKAYDKVLHNFEIWSDITTLLYSNLVLFGLSIAKIAKY